MPKQKKLTHFAVAKGILQDTQIPVGSTLDSIFKKSGAVQLRITKPNNDTILPQTPLSEPLTEAYLKAEDGIYECLAQQTSTIRTDDIFFSTETQILTNENDQCFHRTQTEMVLLDEFPNKKFLTNCFKKANEETATIYRDIYPNLSVKTTNRTDNESITTGIIIELPPGKPLSEILSQDTDFSFDDWLEITQQCITQVCSFHNGTLSQTGKEYIAHGNISPENIYVHSYQDPETDKMQIKVYLTGFQVEMTDIVNAENLKKEMSGKTVKKSNVTIPSEKQTNLSPSFTEDIYRLGILMLGFVPQKKSLFKKHHSTIPITIGLLSDIKENATEISQSSSQKYDKLWNMALKMASAHPKNRPSLEEIGTTCGLSTMTPAERMLKEKMASSQTDEEKEHWAKMAEAIQAVRAGVEAFKQPKQNAFKTIRQSVENTWHRKTIAETKKASEQIIQTTDAQSLEQELPFFIQQLNKQCPLGKKLVSATDSFKKPFENTKDFSDTSSEKTAQEDPQDSPHHQALVYNGF